MTTINELFEKNEKDLAAAIEADFERRKAVPTIRIGPNASVQVIAEETGLSAFRQVKNNRGYSAATDPEARLEFGSVAVASWQHGQRGQNLVHVMEEFCEAMDDAREIAPKLPHWRQVRPAEDIGTIPELPIDKATGIRFRNPWLEPHDLRSQHIVRSLSPRLAKWCEDCAKNGGPTMAMLDELQTERIEAEMLRKIQYGDAEWGQNKLRPGAGATVDERGQFVKSIDDPWLLKFHKQEADAGIPRLKFGNLTVRSMIAKRSPEILEIYKAAEQIFQSWQAEQQKEAA